MPFNIEDTFIDEEIEEKKLEEFNIICNLLKIIYQSYCSIN